MNKTYWLGAVGFVLFLLLAVVVQAPAQLMLANCKPLTGHTCQAGKVQGSLWQGSVTDLALSTPITQLNRISRLSWQVDLVSLVTGKPYVSVAVKTPTINAKGKVGVGTSTISLSDVLIDGQLSVNTATDFIVHVTSASVDANTGRVDALAGQLSATTGQLNLAGQTANLGTLSAVLSAHEGKLGVASTNEQGDFAFDAFCGLSPINYDCDMTVDTSNSSQALDKKLAAFANTRLQPSIYQYQLSGAW